MEFHFTRIKLKVQMISFISDGELFRDRVPQLQPKMTLSISTCQNFHKHLVTFQLIKMTFRLVSLSFVLTKGWNKDVQTFSNLGQISFRAKVGGPQKAVHGEFCYDMPLDGDKT